jgi:hypothetical protein
MNALQRRLAVVTDARATLIAQLSELNELRDRFREAHLAESNIEKKRAYDACHGYASGLAALKLIWLI